jgi:hypothetical protein
VIAKVELLALDPRYRNRGSPCFASPRLERRRARRRHEAEPVGRVHLDSETVGVLAEQLAKCLESRIAILCHARISIAA